MPSRHGTVVSGVRTEHERHRRALSVTVRRAFPLNRPGPGKRESREPRRASGRDPRERVVLSS